MTRDEWREAAFAGWRLGRAGLVAAEIGDVMEIGRLNRRYVRAFERETYDSQERDAAAQARAHHAAENIAQEHGWRLDMSGGLWWTLAVPGYEGNALSGLW